MSNVAIVYYSSTGTNHAMAKAVAEGVAEASGEVRLRLVEENAPREAIEQNPAWRDFVKSTKDEPRATLEDLEWADAVVFGTPTRFGLPAAQLKAFIDSTGPLWMKGKLADKVYAGFTSAINAHGGQESTLLSLYNAVHHFGGILVTPGYTEKVVYATGGNPYGPSVTTGTDGKGPTDDDLVHARLLGKRVTNAARKLASS